MSASNGDFVLPTSFGIQMTQESRSGLESEHCSIGVEDTSESDPLAAGDKSNHSKIMEAHKSIWFQLNVYFEMEC